MWQDRARDQPVYIMHHGRPRLVLAAIEHLESLKSLQHEDSALVDERERLLASLTELVLLIDHDCTVRSCNLPARSFFGISEEGWRARPLGELVQAPFGPFLTTLARRVIDSGVQERIDLEIEKPTHRKISLITIPLPYGAAIIGEDATLTEDRDRAQRALRAIDSALAAVDGLATVQINPRGFVTTPTPSLSAMTKLGTELLESIRFSSLFDVKSRAQVGDAVNAVMNGEGSTRLSAQLLVNDGSMQPVRIGLAPLTSLTGIKGVEAVLVLCPSG
ncbi:hypothetical protein GCM10023219_23510 [Stakelama sediminis]|uniref:hypothetical protein n=2 Tax=Stakelama sediminis TaxID=463200 RepID=UPI001615A183|nr:hypothetical protein [Stakelama sediminis]